MRVVYYSKKGKTKDFSIKVSPYSTSIEDYKETDEDILLITNTLGIGQVPMPVLKFIEQYSDKIKAVVSTGDKEKHAETFAFACDKISKQLNIPCLLKVHLNGTDEDIIKVSKYLNLQNKDKKANENKDLECECPYECPIHIPCSCEDL